MHSPKKLRLCQLCSKNTMENEAHFVLGISLIQLRVNIIFTSSIFFKEKLHDSFEHFFSIYLIKAIFVNDTTKIHVPSPWVRG